MKDEPDPSREYYITVHGFDPVKCRRRIDQSTYAYEACFPLPNDPPLSEAGLRICARVVVREGNPQEGNVRNRIVFKAGDREALVECVHTAVYVAEVGDLWEIDAKKVLDRARSTERKPVHLPPEEHFASLKSFVAGIAEFGLANVFSASYAEDVDPVELPFGFNNMLQRQIMRALHSVAPGATKPLVFEVLSKMVRGMPTDWVVRRMEALEGLFPLRSILTNYEDFTHLAELLGEEGSALLSTVARFPEVDVKILQYMAKSKVPGMRRAAARNFRLPAQAIADLATDGQAAVRRTVAERADLPVRVQWLLARDVDVRVRKAIARNKATGVEVLRALCQDADAAVRAWAELGLGSKVVSESAPSTYNGVPVAAEEASALAKIEVITGREVVTEGGDPEKEPVAKVEDGHVVALELRGFGVGSLGFLDHLPHLRELNVEANKLTSLEIRRPHPTLLTLIANGNAIHDVRGFFHEVPNLIHLDLSWNALSYLPGELGELRALRILEVDNNSLSVLPEALFNLSRLEVLVLSKNSLEELPPSLRKLASLRELAIDGNQLRHLPPEVGHLRSLRVLDASNNPLKELPPEIGKLSRLEVLRANCCQLEGLPEELGDAAALRIVELRKNRLSELPKSIGRLGKLEELYVWDNQLSELPDTIHGLVSLRILDAGTNKLVRLPATLGGMRSLSRLIVDENLLEYLPWEVGELENLQYLNVAFNRLRLVPETICRMSVLRNLNLSKNFLQTLPECIMRLPSLVSLRVSENPLSQLKPNVARWLIEQGKLGIVKDFRIP